MFANSERIKLEGKLLVNVYAVLAHPLREKILKILDSERLVSYKTLLSRLDLKETGLLNYHLKKLEGYVEKNQGFYRLTAKGHNAVNLMLAKSQLMTGKSSDKHITESTSVVQRIGVILCSCGGVIDRTIDVSALTEKLSELPNVVANKAFPFLCMLENLEKIKTWSSKHFLNGLVVAACSPRIHHELFGTISEQLEIPVEFTNIREHCAWVHRRNPELATEKALLLVAASVAKLHHHTPITKRVVPIRKSVAIIGGGLAGLIAASVLAKSALDVILIEKDSCLGGIARKWERIHESADCSPCMISELVASVILPGNVRIFTESELTAITGESGNFEITAIQNPRFVNLTRCTMCGECILACPELKPNAFELGIGQHRIIDLPCPFAYPHKPVIDLEDIEFCRSCRDCLEACPSHAIDFEQESRIAKFTVGGIILAMGADLPNPEEVTTELPISYDPYNDVISSCEFERMGAQSGPTQGKLLRVSDGTPVNSVVILQCISSQNECSGYCCNVAEKYMHLINEMEDDITFTVLYDQTLLPAKPKTISPDVPNVHTCNIKRVRRKGRSHIIETDIGNFTAELVVLNIGMSPKKNLLQLQADIGFNLTQDEYIVPASLPPGIWACGSVSGPKAYLDLQKEAQLAALEAIVFLGRDSLETGEKTVTIDQIKCGLCGLCVEACPHHAITITENNILLDPFRCKGCGICISICHTNAISSQVKDELQATISALSKWKKSPKILVLNCESCGYAALDNAGVRRQEYDPGALVVTLPCIGSIDADIIVSSLQNGFDGVIVVGCSETTCRHLNGIQLAKKKIDSLGEFLGSEIQNRVRFLTVSAIEGHTVADLINKFTEGLVGGTGE